MLFHYLRSRFEDGVNIDLYIEFYLFEGLLEFSWERHPFTWWVRALRALPETFVNFVRGICHWIMWQKCRNYHHHSIPDISGIILMWFVDGDPELFIGAKSCCESRDAVCEAPLKTVLHNLNTVTNIKLWWLQVNSRPAARVFPFPDLRAFVE